MTPALGNPGASVPLGLRFATERSTSGSVVGPEPAWLGTGNWEDDRSVSDTNDHDLTWRTGHVALAVDHMAGHLEVLTFVHLDALGPAGTELERGVSLQHIADVTFSPWWCHPDIVSGAACACLRWWRPEAARTCPLAPFLGQNQFRILHRAALVICTLATPGRTAHSDS